MPIDIRKVNRIAAALAVSNMGQLGLNVPVSRVTNWRIPRNIAHSSPTGEVCDIAAAIIETDEHEEIFADEAEGWAATVQECDTLEQLADRFPYHREWIMEIDKMELPA